MKKTLSFYFIVMAIIVIGCRREQEQLDTSTLDELYDEEAAGFLVTESTAWDPSTKGEAHSPPPPHGESKEATYERKRSELYDLAESVDGYIDTLRHSENFARTNDRLSRFRLNLTPAGEKRLGEVLFRTEIYLKLALFLGQAQASRVEKLRVVEEDVAEQIIGGVLPGESLRALYANLLSTYDCYSASKHSGGEGDPRNLWNYLMGWGLYAWEHPSNLAAPGTFEFGKVGAELDVEKWSEFRLVVCQETKKEFIRGDLTAGDLFVQLAVIRLSEAWLRNVVASDQYVIEFVSLVEKRWPGGLSAAYGRHYADGAAADAKRNGFETLGRDLVEKTRREALASPNAKIEFNHPIISPEHLDNLESMDIDATWLEELLEEHLFSYPWPWPTERFDTWRNALGSTTESRKRS